MGTGSLPQGVNRPGSGVGHTSTSIPLLPLWIFEACSNFFASTFIEKEEDCASTGLRAQEDSAVAILISNSQVVLCYIHTTCEPEVYSLRNVTTVG